MDTVELQLCSDLYFTLNGTNGKMQRIDVLLRVDLVDRDTAIVQIADHRKVEKALSGLDIRNICGPFRVCLIRPPESLASRRFGHLCKPARSCDISFFSYGKQVVFLHDAKDRFGIANTLPFQPNLNAMITVGAMTISRTFSASGRSLAEMVLL